MKRVLGLDLGSTSIGWAVIEENTTEQLTDTQSQEKDKIIDKLTVATIKFADLLPYRTTDYIFDLEKFSSFEGKTGPYILYTYLRMNKIVENCGLKSPGAGICFSLPVDQVVGLSSISD